MEDEQGPIQGTVVFRSPYGRTFKRMRSGAVDSGVRSTAANESPPPPPHPPLKTVQPLAKIDRPGPEWSDPPDNIGI